MISTINEGLALPVSFLARMNAAVFGVFQPLLSRSPLLTRLLQPLTWLNPTILTLLQSVFIVSMLPFVTALGASAAMFSYTFFAETFLAPFRALAKIAAESVGDFKDIRETLNANFYQNTQDKTSLQSAPAMLKLMTLSLLNYGALSIKIMGLSLISSPEFMREGYQNARSAAKQTYSDVMDHRISKLIRNPFSRVFEKQMLQMAREDRVQQTEKERLAGRISALEGLTHQLDATLFDMKSKLQELHCELSDRISELQKNGSEPLAIATLTANLERVIRSCGHLQIAMQVLHERGIARDKQSALQMKALSVEVGNLVQEHAKTLQQSVSNDINEQSEKINDLMNTVKDLSGRLALVRNHVDEKLGNQPDLMPIFSKMTDAEAEINKMANELLALKDSVCPIIDKAASVVEKATEFRANEIAQVKDSLEQLGARVANADATATSLTLLIGEHAKQMATAFVMDRHNYKLPIRFEENESIALGEIRQQSASPTNGIN